ncbi:MAG: NUDIX hydrolase [Actinomycetota bacterium]|nr:NUDIX hydrolase [Actinomycetota bacterium]
MIARLPAPLKRVGLSAFRRMPASLRRRAVHAGTPNYTVGAVVVVRDAAGRVLLVRQRHSGGWSLPGGLLGHGETPELAALRELGEELGLSVEAGRLQPATPNAVVDPRARRVDMVYSLREPAEISVDGLEVLEARWFAPEGLPARCWGATRQILQTLTP